MVHGERSDTELLRLAQDGASPAFAVLVHRHGPAVRARVGSDDDPVGAVIATFVTAMRQLPRRSPDEPVRPWLLELAAAQVDDPTPVGTSPLPPLDPDEADEIWAELDVRWPDGKVRRSAPRWLAWVALVIALVALAVLLPYLLLTVGNGDEDGAALEELVARPFEDEQEDEREPAEQLFDGPLGGLDGDGPTDDGPLGGLDGDGPTDDDPLGGLDGDGPTDDAPIDDGTVADDDTPEVDDPADDLTGLDPGPDQQPAAEEGP